jgi:peptide deformylase
MAPLTIHTYGDPILRQAARPIQNVTDAHRALAREMAQLMYGARGIGLAANQVGVLERIIVVDVDWTDRKTKTEVHPHSPIAMINPEIIEESIEDEAVSEGCLSLPAIDGDVWRATHIRYRYVNLNGDTVEAEAEDLKARCIQHEIDHLNGILFIDHLAPDAREKLAGRLAQLRQGGVGSQAANL